MNLLLSSLGNHLWQSTVFAGIAALLTLLFRKNRARVRHSMWFAASLKFLLPFAALLALGSHIHLRTATGMLQSPLSVAMADVSQPFIAPVLSSPIMPLVPARNPLPTILFGVWAVGFIGISGSWLVRWRRIRNAVHAGSPLRLKIPIKLVSSSRFLEPGVYGIFRPVLFLPEGISDHLTPEQLQSVIEHELCHVRHRDNLTAAIQMFVETVFWFHPLVWWIGTRMVMERERACDEEVVSSGDNPRVYAEGILRVCQFYLESPVACVSGVTGSDLKKRVERIMGNHVGETLNGWRKIFLAIAGAVALAVPVVAGMVTSPKTPAQATADLPKFDAVSIKLNKSGDRFSRMNLQQSGGHYIGTNVTLRNLLTNAYNLTVTQMSHAVFGTPNWIDSEHFDIEAVAKGNPTVDQKRLMIQSLLGDRFKLTAHHETRQLPVFALVVSKSGSLGPQMNPHSDDTKCYTPSPGTPPPPPTPGAVPLAPCGGFRGFGAGGNVGQQAYVAQRVTMETLAQMVEFFGQLDRPVVDRTGLSGTFDLILRFALQPLNAQTHATTVDPGSPTIVTALQEQLGLKLESTTGPVDVLVIDHVEEPTPN